jgi:hypothetical protein
MICPNCKCEYIRGVKECADCGVALVDTLESPKATLAGDVRIVPIWRGKDSAECDKVKEALESADIPFTAPDSKSFFSFLPTEPILEIWISEEDQEKARKMVLDLEGRTDPGELTTEELESLALPESDEPGSEDQSVSPGVPPEDWHEDEPVSEVWSGESEPFADTLIICLREVGIASHKFSEAGHWRLVVPSGEEARAKEIVREVVEASPPE